MFGEEEEEEEGEEVDLRKKGRKEARTDIDGEKDVKKVREWKKGGRMREMIMKGRK